MFESILGRIRKRRQGIGNKMLVLYGCIWLIRKLSLGLVEFDYRYILLQKVAQKPLLKGPARGGRQTLVLKGEALKSEDARDTNGAFSREPRDDARFLRRVERGDICVTSMREQRAEGVLWLSFGEFDEPDVKANFVVSPQHGMAWDSNLYIVDDARGGFIFAELWDGANEVLRGMSYRVIATQTSAFNGASLQAHRRMGAERIARILYILVGRSQITLTSLRPHFSILLPSDKAPVYKIPAPDMLSEE